MRLTHAAPTTPLPRATCFAYAHTALETAAGQALTLRVKLSTTLVPGALANSQQEQYTHWIERKGRSRCVPLVSPLLVFSLRTR